jgi:hypothetical protein
VGYVFGSDDTLLSGCFHLAPTETEESGSGMAVGEFGDDL